MTAVISGSFETAKVVKYLAKSYPYAASCFAQDNATSDVDSLDVEKWFKRYFTSEMSYILYRDLSANVMQIIKL